MYYLQTLRDAYTVARSSSYGFVRKSVDAIVFEENMSCAQKLGCLTWLESYASTCAMANVGAFEMLGDYAGALHAFLPRTTLHVNLRGGTSLAASSIRPAVQYRCKEAITHLQQCNLSEHETIASISRRQYQVALTTKGTDRVMRSCDLLPTGGRAIFELAVQSAIHNDRLYPVAAGLLRNAWTGEPPQSTTEASRAKQQTTMPMACNHVFYETRMGMLGRTATHQYAQLGKLFEMADVKSKHYNPRLPNLSRRLSKDFKSMKRNIDKGLGFKYVNKHIFPRSHNHENCASSTISDKERLYFADYLPIHQHVADSWTHITCELLQFARQHNPLAETEEQLHERRVWISIFLFTRALTCSHCRTVYGTTPWSLLGLPPFTRSENLS